jgi:hypothetical protein
VRADPLGAASGQTYAAHTALAMAWLDQRLPLTLIMDLSMPFGPHSTELLAAEPAAPPRPAGATDFTRAAGPC